VWASGNGTGERGSVAVGNGTYPGNGTGHMRKRNRTSFDGERAREAGRRSAEARAARRLEAEQAHSPPPGEWEGAPPSLLGPTDAWKVSEPRDLRQLSEDALVDLLKSPSQTARVQAAKVLHERSQPRAEPEPVGDAPRAHSLVDLLELAAKAGLEVNEEAVVAAIRRGILARDAERAVEHPSERQGSRVANEFCRGPETPGSDAENVGGLRRALGSDPA
jgi:hypothetical protein